MSNRLFRSRTDRVLGGVCAGLAEYLALDPTLVRVFFVVLALADGIGVLLYLLLWVVLPVRDMPPAKLEERVEGGAREIAGKAGELGGELAEVARSRDARLKPWIGVSLVLLGGYLLLRQFDFPWLAWLDLDVLWPALLILGGLAMLLRRGRGGDE